jgi:membrane-associated phospholipid phosphatase
MINKRVILAISFVLLIIFYFFSREVKRGFLKETDFAVTVKLQERIDTSTRLRFAAFIGNVFEGSTFTASPGVSVVFVGLLTIAALYDRKRKRFNWKAFIIPVMFALLVAGELYGKSVVHHPAPPFFMIKNPTTIFPKYYINEMYSYPSGHVARAVFIGIIAYALFIIPYSLFRRKKVKVFVVTGIIGYIFMVSISRIYLGHHWLSDVIGGALLGSGLGILTPAINSRIID